MDITTPVARLIDKLVRHKGRFKDTRTGTIITSKHHYCLVQESTGVSVCAVPERGTVKNNGKAGGKPVLLGLSSSQPLPITTRTLSFYTNRITPEHGLLDELVRINWLNEKDNKDLRFIAYIDLDKDTFNSLQLNHEDTHHEESYPQG